MACSSAIIVTQCVSNIRKEITSSDEHNDVTISNELTILKAELDKEIAVRVLAAKEGLYQLLIDCLNKMEPQYLIQVLETLTSLTNGYPDLLDKSGQDFMIAFLHTTTNVDLIIQNIKWMKNCVAKHEKNRADLIDLGVQDRFRNILSKFKDEPKLVVQVCQLVRRLVSDDDIRVAHGNPHEHARALAKETLCLFVSLLDKYQSNAIVLNDILQVICALIVRDEFCIKVYNQNGLRFIMDAMIAFLDDEKINRQCLLLLKGLAGNDQIKEAIIAEGFAPQIIFAMSKHKSSANLISAGCVCISALALRSPNNSQALIEAGAAELLVSVLNIYKDNHVILNNACMAIRNQLSRYPNAKDEYLQLGLEELLNELQTKGKLEYETKAVLRELGCDVKLEEPWKGEGRQLAQ
ncbi:UNVERIFIED_CONTAM: hypothetical protein PYX00_000123 [Menopon gallinae]